MKLSRPSPSLVVARFTIPRSTPSHPAGSVLSVPYNARSKTAGITRATTARKSIVAVLVAVVR